MPTFLNKSLRTKTEIRFQNAWSRQRNTAADILNRLQTQEGVILADQVGMGKTYVALAVAVSEILSTREMKQVVIFVPASVVDKWIRECQKFCETLLEPDTGIRCSAEPVRSAEGFLRKLSAGKASTEHLIVVTHTALTTSLKDGFIQLALLYYAIRGVTGVAGLRKSIAKWSTGLKGLIPHPKFNPDRVAALLSKPPTTWRATWLDLTGEDLGDDPVPHRLEVAVKNCKLQPLRSLIEALPVNSSADIGRRLETARKAIAEASQAVWAWIIASTDIELPLLIVDEAHRLKNPKTQISKLFGRLPDDDGPSALRGIFGRMLFLTATPFELGHAELTEVLNRMGAVRPDNALPSIPLTERLDTLKEVLTQAQTSASQFDNVWARLSQSDLAYFDYWDETTPPPSISAAAREAWRHAQLTVKARRTMHRALRPWIIRHERARRRSYYTGAAIYPNGDSCVGLEIPEKSALPFLLAARAQSIAADEKSGRPFFAYGIASSYEAFGRIESQQNSAGRDSDLPEEDRVSNGGTNAARNNAEAHIGTDARSDAVRWYHREIDCALKIDAGGLHPKLQATVEKASQLWQQGEKCLIFCWYIKTGEAVERALAKRIDGMILERAAKALNLASIDETRDALERISERLFRRDAPSYGRIRDHLVAALTGAAGGYQDVLDLIVDAAIRHLRTPSYLVRYTTLHQELTVTDVWDGINGANSCGLKLLDQWRIFAERLASARKQIGLLRQGDEQDSEFTRVKAALLGADREHDAMARRGASLHPVRRAHGGTERHIRERLIALFNTPLSPDLLVASSVMGEGIDLHQACRFVIHHDLDWNPSVLEQRTGRLDRIGALAERIEKNIEVFEPYLAGTHDEKMFRVVKDRAQWFDVVMGRATGSDEHGTDAEENRQPLHTLIRDALSMDLSSTVRE